VARPLQEQRKPVFFEIGYGKACIDTSDELCHGSDSIEFRSLLPFPALSAASHAQFCDRDASV
jgi:hypothetical protein